MKVVLKCSNLKYEDIKNIEYAENKIFLYCTDGKIFKYDIVKKIGTYIVITDEDLEYFHMEGVPNE
jgi:hypothetical protein